MVVDIEENMDEGYDGWLEGQGILAALGPLWTDLSQGNYACFYLIRAHFIKTTYSLTILPLAAPFPCSTLKK